ncbi:glycosyltransferase [Pseudonocardia sp. DR1-2]|uniref:glycosyltransferase family 2 protein n=1 Tax=Pseudonocardia sp. DR1-2 TaxID=2951168 RepID=UPI002044B595|nr:glycosyltransferase [Pseudonocardia sp. DR1-2]MCM3844673.1 glycosyltransferase [Pseudonocardia sp. DR1-2]
MSPTPPQINPASLPRVSVVVPVKDTPPELLLAAVRSVVDQDTEELLEIVVHDDGSTDPSTVATVRDLPDLSTPCRVVRVGRSSRNAGISAARNLACRAARGEWFLWLDSDDMLPSDAVRVLRSAAGTRPKLVLGACRVLLPDGSTIVHRSKPFLQDWRTLRRRLDDPLLGAVFAVHGGLVHQSLVAAVGGFDESLRYAELTDFVLRVVGGLRPDQVGHVDRPTYVYRRRAGSHSADRDALERARRDVLRRYGLTAGLRTRAGFRERCTATGARLYDVRLSDSAVGALPVVPAQSP